MASTLTRFAVRRARNIAILLALVAASLVADVVGSAALYRTAFPSGWLLISVVVLLAAYNVRKKFTTLPLGNSSTWLQLHIYAGLFSGFLFVVHVQWRIPSGAFDLCLGGLFTLVFLSGVFGLVVSRLFARRLGIRGGDVLYGRIPRLRFELRSQVERLVLTGVEDSESTLVASFYNDRLKSYFDGPRNFWSHLSLSERPLKKLLSEIGWQDQYTNEVDRKTLSQIADRVRRKNDLDFQFAHQAVLKYWLFIHVPLTYALLAFAVIHVVLVHAFVGATQS